MALGWLGGNRVDHPMADPRRAREIVSELPAQDALKALGEITEWLESLNATPGFRLERLFENIDLLDAAAKAHQRRVGQDYLATPRRQRFQENRLYGAGSGFWRALGEAYLRCVREYEANGPGASAMRRQMPVVAARAMRALGLRIKWTMLRYGTVEARVWSDLAALYTLAEQRGFAEATIAVYPGAHGESSVQREFLRALMLSSSSLEGLPPLRQEIAERIVAHFSHLFVLSAQPGGCTHGFDLGAPRKPVRLGAAPSSPGWRCFGAGAAGPAVEALRGQVERNGVPSDLPLGAHYDRDMVAAVLRHLALHWSATPPARASERRDVAGRLTVVAGLPEIVNVLDPATSDDLDFSGQQEAPAAENWVVFNVSEGGYGAIIPAQKGDWVKVGTLVGLRSETSTHWGVGLIRRITRDEHEQRQVGIELLTRTAIPIKVSRPGSAGGELHSAILLSTSPDRQGEVGVLLREGVFNMRDSLDMTVRDKAYLLMPSRMVEDGEDFDWAKFKVMRRSA